MHRLLIVRGSTNMIIPKSARLSAFAADLRYQASLIDEFGGYLEDELSARICSSSRALWIEIKGQTFYPGFQFDENRDLKASMIEIITRLKLLKTPPQIVYWLTLPIVGIGNNRPIDLLNSFDNADHLLLEALIRNLEDPRPYT